MAQASSESAPSSFCTAPMRAIHIKHLMMSCFHVAPVRRISKPFAIIFNPDNFSLINNDSSIPISSLDSSFACKRSDLIELSAILNLLAYQRAKFHNIRDLRYTGKWSIGEPSLFILLSFYGT